MNDLMVMTQIAGRRCALPAHDVKSVIELSTITPVPQTPDFIAGITAMRSQALTVIDCRLALGFAEGDWETDDRAAVVAIDGHFYALLIDAIEDITTTTSEPGQVSGGFGPEWSRVAKGMIETAAGPALLINFPALIAGPGDNQAGLHAAA
ncbi:chemotaxis protein CheW [Erythrobacter rubeus]|uniref:Chemotaxis protein CheW n=1 Tax=Erythrobacter rubeus TaxID=2760803 RepID=A0ABR8KPX9_9SPHN|nr:chemotaxis protein CheW [Erythrobacter rubeus]MBD2842777.1 chemotaxis protein CheW [Erythrobacter rubeus]